MRGAQRDLTSYNLLVTDKWEAKLADFNLSRALREGEAAAQLSQLINSPEWSAPERLAGQMYGKAADVFSFGVILYGAPLALRGAHTTAVALAALTCKLQGASMGRRRGRPCSHTSAPGEWMERLGPSSAVCSPLQLTRSHGACGCCAQSW